MHLPLAQKLAEKILAEISPYCLKAEIAGSIRRRRPFVNDIDLVLLPRDGNLLALQERFHKSCKVLKEGQQNAMYELANGFQLDVFFAYQKEALFTPMTTNWGTLLLCRTGSKEHNIYLIEQAKKINRAWRPYAGVFDLDTGDCLACATEESIFEALGLPFIPPQSRER